MHEWVHFLRRPNQEIKSTRSLGLVSSRCPAHSRNDSLCGWGIGSRGRLHQCFLWIMMNAVDLCETFWASDIENRFLRSGLTPNVIFVVVVVVTLLKCGAVYHVPGKRMVRKSEKTKTSRVNPDSYFSPQNSSRKLHRDVSWWSTFLWAVFVLPLKLYP